MSGVSAERYAMHTTGWLHRTGYWTSCGAAVIREKVGQGREKEGLGRKYISQHAGVQAGVVVYAF